VGGVLRPHRTIANGRIVYALDVIERVVAEAVFAAHRRLGLRIPALRALAPAARAPRVFGVRGHLNCWPSGS
jgi:hypothetical protein